MTDKHVPGGLVRLAPVLTHVYLNMPTTFAFKLVSYLVDRKPVSISTESTFENKASVENSFLN